MKKIINNPYQVVDETIAGILKAYPYHLRAAEGSSRALVRADAPVKNKVGICTGGGSGHIPVFLGYVGPGLLDGVAIGNVFSLRVTYVRERQDRYRGFVRQRKRHLLFGDGFYLRHSEI